MPKKTNQYRTTLAVLDPMPPIRKKVSEFTIPSAEHPSESTYQQIIDELERAISQIDDLIEQTNLVKGRDAKNST